jgi:hypothetical protein
MNIVRTLKALTAVVIASGALAATSKAQEVFVTGAGSLPLAFKTKAVQFEHFALTAHVSKDKRVSGFVILRSSEGTIKGHVVCLAADQVKVPPTGDVVGVAGVVFEIESSSHPNFKAGQMYGIDLTDQGNPCDGALWDTFSGQVEKPACKYTGTGQPIECGNILIEFKD